jgi:protein ImuA
MPAVKADILAQLQREILSLQGYKPITNNSVVNNGLGPIANAFPNKEFPVGAVHELIAESPEDLSASCGFIAGIIAALSAEGGVAIWLSSSKNLFPPALKLFSVDPCRIIFIDLQRDRDVLWAMEEALKCNSLTVVIGELKELNFTQSRRLQLAVEMSKVTGLVLRYKSKNLGTTTCISRWKISSLPSSLPGDMPGVGFPRWKVDLLKVRNGKPGSWTIEWVNKQFRHFIMAPVIEQQPQKKVV